MESSSRLDELRGLLVEGLEEIPLAVTDDQVDSLLELSLLVSAWNRRINLTGHRELESVVRRLLLDAAALLSVLPEFSTLADLGSGAGFPGLPFAILRRTPRVLLVESRARRVHFQRAAIRQLGLTNATACHGRIEALDPRPCALVVAQALGPPRQVIEWMLPWVEVGGLLVIPGGPEPPDPGSTQHVLEPRILHYRVPLEGPRRTAWVARRSS
jgi:16S rRNA (guanine527-N7)-methyltransferase